MRASAVLLPAILQSTVITGGLVVALLFSTSALSSLTAALDTLGMDTASLRSLGSPATNQMVHTAVASTLAAAAAIGASGIILAVARVWLAEISRWNHQNENRGRFWVYRRYFSGGSSSFRKEQPKDSRLVQFWWSVLVEGVIVPALGAVAFSSFFFFGGCILAMGSAFVLDQLAQRSLSSDLGDQMAALRQLKLESYNTWSSCPKPCIDLSTLTHFSHPPLSFGLGLPAGYVNSGSPIPADGGSCLCDLSRFSQVQQLAASSWRNMLWAALGLLLSYMGSSGAMVYMAIARERVVNEGHRVAATTERTGPRRGHSQQSVKIKRKGQRHSSSTTVDHASRGAEPV